jgi:hypothetical protein
MLCSKGISNLHLTSQASPGIKTMLKNSLLLQCEKWVGI